MKSITLTTTLLILFRFSDLSAQCLSAEWLALENFHTVIAAVYYPTEKGNLMPLRKRSQELATKAVLLNESALPTKFSEKEIRKIIKVILSKARTLNKLVKKNSNDRLLI
jgi:hypothetical protein